MILKVCISWPLALLLTCLQKDHLLSPPAQSDPISSYYPNQLCPSLLYVRSVMNALLRSLGSSIAAANSAPSVRPPFLF